MNQISDHRSKKIYIKTIITDRALACINAARVCFPVADIQMCIWQVKKNIKLQLTKNFPDISVQFLDEFNVILFKKNIEECERVKM
jgi:hypothetical protein